MNESQMSSGEFLTVQQVADELKVSRGLIYKLMGTGELGYTKLGRCRRIPRSAVRNLTAAGSVGCELAGVSK